MDPQVIAMLRQKAQAGQPLSQAEQQMLMQAEAMMRQQQPRGGLLGMFDRQQMPQMPQQGQAIVAIRG